MADFGEVTIITRRGFGDPTRDSIESLSRGVSGYKYLKLKRRGETSMQWFSLPNKQVKTGWTRRDYAVFVGVVERRLIVGRRRAGEFDEPRIPRDPFDQRASGVGSLPARRRLLAFLREIERHHGRHSPLSRAEHCCSPSIRPPQNSQTAETGRCWSVSPLCVSVLIGPPPQGRPL